MSIVNWLESPEQFRKMLAALISDQDYRWDALRRAVSFNDPVLRQFSATQWAQNRLPDDQDILAVVTLFITYQFRRLLVDVVRSDGLVEGVFQDELNVTLLLPLYIWPAYQIWVLQEFPAKARHNQSQAIPWLLNQHLRIQAFKELDIPEPNEKFLAYIDVKKNTTNLSRWVKAGCESLHFAIHLGTKNAPLSSRAIRTDALQEFDAKPEAISDSNKVTYTAGISQLTDATELGPKSEIGEPANRYLNSPIYQPYLQWEDVLETFVELHQAEYKSPSLCQIARKIIDQNITAVGLDLYQQAQAFELLSDLSEWIDLDTAHDSSISIKNIEVRWGQFHHSDVFPLIKALLETNLLQIIGQGGNVSVAHPLIRDYLFSMKHVKQLHSTSPIPPHGIALSTWLYWIVCHWLDYGDRDRAGKILWNAAGALPGFNSGAWVQLGLLLAHLPGEVMREPYTWLLTSIVREVFYYSRNSRHDVRDWLSENADFLMDTSYSIESQCREFAQILEDYRESLRRYHSVICLDNPCILEMALGFDPSSRSDLWIRKHAFSSLKALTPEQEVEIRLMPYVYKQKKLYDVILDYARKENNWELKLAAAELLVSWGVQDTISILAERSITELPDEFYHRSKILYFALKGMPAYANWV